MRCKLIWCAVLTLFFVGCDKKEKGSDEKEKKPESVTADSTDDEKEEKPPSAETVDDYQPLKGPGPHQGFDMKEIRQKLQGTWLVGGSAFSNIPHIWHIEGDRITIVRDGEKKKPGTMRLLAPCVLMEDHGSSAVYHTFVFDGDTLYAGLGNAGLKMGDKTVACQAAGVFVHQGDKCTLWRRRTFAKPGENQWQEDTGDCGYEDDGKKFFGDDTRSSRKIYGKSALDVQGDVLLTRQMAGNKATRVANLEEAMTVQKDKIAAKEALKHPPKNLPFLEWDLPEVNIRPEGRVHVWAAGINRKGNWAFGHNYYGGLNDNIHKMFLLGSDVWMPDAFMKLAEPAKGLKRGTPVLLNSVKRTYARVVRVKGDTVTVETAWNDRTREQEKKTTEVLPITRGGWDMGALVTYKNEDGHYDTAMIVLAHGEKVYLMAETLVVKNKNDLTLLDLRPMRVGTRVWAIPPSGVSPLRYEKARIVKVHGQGAGYELKTDSGRTFHQSFDRVFRQ